MKKSINSPLFNVLQGPTTQKRNVVLRKEKKIEHANENELLLSSSGVVLEVNERGKNFYKSLRDLVERIQQRASNVICNHCIFRTLGTINKKFSIKY